MDKKNILKKSTIIAFIVWMLLFSSVSGVLSSVTTPEESTVTEPGNKSYSHNIFAEFFTMTTCVPCKYSHQALKELYAEEWHPFYYITYVYNKNNNSKQRKSELQVVGSPTTKFDGGYKTVTGGSSVETEKTRFNNSILACGARSVKDIDLSLDVEWLGAVNNYPEDGETNVPIEVVLNWTISEMKIDVEVKNNEASEYDGHVHVQVTEVESVWWDDKFGNPYTFEFKSYAYNDDVPIDAGDTWSETIYYDGVDHNDADNPPRYFDHITEDNIQVLATAMDKDNDKYVDETAGFRTGVDTDPKTFTVYFGDTNPPPLVMINGSAMKYNPFGDLNWTTTYYWKVNVWNNKSEPTYGDVWSFTTRGNTPPYPPIPIDPLNGSQNAPIDTILNWSGGDPEGDDTTYDVYFGEWNLQGDIPQVAWNHTETTYDPTPIGENLEFNTKYAWKIVSWDKYGLNTSGEPWNFITEPNYPPDPAHDPIPPDGASAVPGDAILTWNGSDPNSGDKIKYDVYFSINYPPTLQSINQPENYFDPYGQTEMPLYEDYYWKIVTRDMEGEETEGPNWTFSTGINHEPTAPDIDGPSNGDPEIEYTFTFVSTDQDNHTIRYLVDWDDGNSEITDYYESGEVVTLNHTWKEGEDKKEYTIKATAEDTFHEKSSVSEFTFNVKRNKVVNCNLNLLNWFLERFPNAFPMLRYLLKLL